MTNTVDRRSMATIPDVARQAGVSTATAARALGGYGSVSATTRERVLAVAEELGYRPNGLARSMITGSTQTLGVVLSDIENSFFHRALRGVADTARARGYEVLLANTDEDLEAERKAVSVLAERRVDGLIVCPTDDGDHAHLEAVIASGIPVVLLDRRVSGLHADTVGIDNRKAARDATTRLIEHGHRRIGILTGGTPAAVGRRLSTPAMKGVERLAATTVGARAAGYRDALLAVGVSPRPEYLSANGFHREDAALATTTMMSLPEPPTAIFAFDSILALGALQAFRTMGLRCPEDVSLVGFDDAEWAEVVSPPLSVVAQPVYDIGVAACELLLARIGGEGKRPVHQRLRTTFMDRESIAAPPGSMRNVS
jgi:LacI family transcriptional regulator